LDRAASALLGNVPGRVSVNDLHSLGGFLHGDAPFLLPDFGRPGVDGWLWRRAGNLAMFRSGTAPTDRTNDRNGALSGQLRRRHIAGDDDLYVVE
jgi:hypothetical protein